MVLFLIAVLLWFITGLIVTHYFGSSISGLIRKFNKRYAAEYAQAFRKRGAPANPERMGRILFWVEMGSCFFAFLLLFVYPFFALWTIGAMLFGIAYIAKLLRMLEIEKFDDQMIDVTYAMKNSLKAGMTLQQAMAMVASEFQPPAAEQFGIAVREVQLGATVEESLRHIEERVPNLELKAIVTAVEILRQTGGNMIETFELIVETLKNRKRVEGKIKALTAQGRMSALILCSMPFFMALMLYFLNRPYIEPLFATKLGNLILTIVLLLVSTGWVLIKKLISIEV
jgi:Flp pilus assembly protein TadB